MIKDGVIKTLRWEANFVTVENDFARSRIMSPFTKSVLLDTMSRANSWETTIGGIMKNHECGRDKARTVLSEGAEAGYVFARKVRDANGRIVGVEYHVSSNRQALREFVSGKGWDDESPEPEKPGPCSPGPGSGRQLNKRQKLKKEARDDTTAPSAPTSRPSKAPAPCAPSGDLLGKSARKSKSESQAVFQKRSAKLPPKAQSEGGRPGGAEPQALSPAEGLEGAADVFEVRPTAEKSSPVHVFAHWLLSNDAHYGAAFDPAIIGPGYIQALGRIIRIEGREMVERAHARHLSHEGEAIANAYVTGQPGKPKHRIKTWNYLVPIINQLKAEDARETA
jgi:hypothetical protein